MKKIAWCCRFLGLEGYFQHVLSVLMNPHLQAAEPSLADRYYSGNILFFLSYLFISGSLGLGFISVNVYSETHVARYRST